MRSFAMFLEKHAKGRTLLLLFVFTNLTYGYMLLVTIPTLTEFSGGLDIPDMMPLGYDHNYLENLMTELDTDGRQYYMNRQIPVDMLYPLLFGLTYALLTAWVFMKLDAFARPFPYVAQLPLIAAIADYAENLGLMTILRNYPEWPDWLSEMTSAFTRIKSASTTAYFVCLLLGLAYVLIWSKFFKKDSLSERANDPE